MCGLQVLCVTVDFCKIYLGNISQALNFWWFQITNQTKIAFGPHYRDRQLWNPILNWLLTTPFDQLLLLWLAQIHFLHILSVTPSIIVSILFQLEGKSSRYINACIIRTLQSQLPVNLYQTDYFKFIHLLKLALNYLLFVGCT